MFRCLLLNFEKLKIGEKKKITILAIYSIKKKEKKKCRSERGVGAGVSATKGGGKKHHQKVETIIWLKTCDFWKNGKFRYVFLLLMWIPPQEPFHN